MKYKILFMIPSPERKDIYINWLRILVGSIKK